MKYSKDYPKLSKTKYTTIRRYKKANIGQIVLESYPSGSHLACVFNERLMKLREIKTGFLCQDTGTFSRKEAIDLIQSFYNKPIGQDNLYVYNLVKIFILKEGGD